MRHALLLLCLSATLVLAYCSTSKKVQSAPAKIAYANNVQPIIAASCSPCHMPPKGNKKPLDNYAAVRSNIDDIVIRIEKNPGEKGFMPARHPKLPDSTILVLKQWKTDGLQEK